MVGPPPNTLEDTCPIQYIEWVKAAMNITHEFVFKHLGVATTWQKAHCDHVLKPCSYEIREWVWRFYPPTDGLKISQGWTGPYLIIHMHTNLTYSIQKSDKSPI